jgi:hypothetical protein
MIPEATPLTCRRALDRPSAAESLRAACGPAMVRFAVFRDGCADEGPYVTAAAMNPTSHSLSDRQGVAPMLPR